MTGIPLGARGDEKQSRRPRDIHLALNRKLEPGGIAGDSTITRGWPKTRLGYLPGSEHQGPACLSADGYFPRPVIGEGEASTLLVQDLLRPTSLRRELSRGGSCTASEASLLLPAAALLCSSSRLPAASPQITMGSTDPLSFSFPPQSSRRPPRVGVRHCSALGPHFLDSRTLLRPSARSSPRAVDGGLLTMPPTGR